ncbi:polysaccharide biosynthesis/export family protein [Paraburkholderia phosphatilytica]|uniref:polysaccharide biosynthesis/export family protein n=1 Tax=Paraburkholderia phosphatilytica TaxID=2282883 RepID=UPI001F0C3DD0|nr:polysaccharide biosynthesis/export family protein [Paraburkholderia phosphatilytica]
MTIKTIAALPASFAMRPLSAVVPKRSAAAIAVVLATTLLGACSLAPGPYLDKDRLDDTTPATNAADKYHVQPIDIAYFAQERAAALPSVCPLVCLTKTVRASYSYHVGVNDQLTVIVWDHPELTGNGTLGLPGTPPLPQGNNGSLTLGNAATPAGTAISTGGGVEGGLSVRVATDGTIYFPRVGRVHVLGENVQQIQQQLIHGLAKTIRDPQIDVRVSGFNSQVVQVTGSVKEPAAESITDLPLSVIDAINRAGGALPDADLQNVGVTRDGTRYRVDVAALLETGDPQQNVVLKDGDIIDVPDRSNSRVFVLGEVMKPTSLPMNRGKLTLADALTGAQGLDVRTGDPRYIYVIRGVEGMMHPGATSAGAATTPVSTNATAGAPAAATPATLKTDGNTPVPSVYRLDMTQVDALMLMTKFELQPRDVVYVQVASSARFNRLLDQISPTLQTLFFTKELGR